MTSPYDQTVFETSKMDDKNIWSIENTTINTKYSTMKNNYDSKTSKDNFDQNSNAWTVEETTINSKTETNAISFETSKDLQQESTNFSREFNNEATLTTKYQIFSSNKIKESKNAEISSLETTQSSTKKDGSSTHLTEISMTGKFNKFQNSIPQWKVISSKEL